MERTIDIPIWNGWHVTIFQPVFWLLLIAEAGLVFLSMKLWRVH